MAFWKKENPSKKKGHFGRNSHLSDPLRPISAAFWGLLWLKEPKYPLSASFGSFSCLSIPFGFRPKLPISKSPLSVLAETLSVELYRVHTHWHGGEYDQCELPAVTEGRYERRGERGAHPHEHGDLLAHALLELVNVPAERYKKSLSQVQ